MKSILVIGGGLIGAASALRLQAAGMQTRLIDPGDQRRAASYGNAGHIGAEQVNPWSAWTNVWRAPASSFALGGPLDFRWSDVGLWAPWSLRFLAACGAERHARGQAALSALLADTMDAWARLAALADKPELVIPHGHVTAWATPRSAERGLAAAARAAWGATSYRELAAAELERYAQVMANPPTAAILVSGTGQVSDPQGARDAMLAKFALLGGEIIADRVTKIEASSNRIVANLSGTSLEADAVLVAAGAWSGRLMRMLGVDAPLIGERGYHLHSTETDWPFDLPTTVFEESFVVFSRFTSGLRATSCIEFGSPDAPGDDRKWALLRRRIDDLGVRFSAAPDRWVGSRPTLPDYVPAIGRLERAPNVLYAFGHAHLGLTMCAVTAEIVAALATEQAPPVDVAPFKVERFA